MCRSLSILETWSIFPCWTFVKHLGCCILYSAHPLLSRGRSKNPQWYRGKGTAKNASLAFSCHMQMSAGDVGGIASAGVWSWRWAHSACVSLRLLSPVCRSSTQEAGCGASRQPAPVFRVWDNTVNGALPREGHSSPNTKPDYTQILILRVHFGKEFHAQIFIEVWPFSLKQYFFSLK